jgi:hypothetical protein
MSPLGTDRRSPPDRPERVLRRQHRIDGLQEGRGDRHPPHISKTGLREQPASHLSVTVHCPPCGSVIFRP